MLTLLLFNVYYVWQTKRIEPNLNCFVFFCTDGTENLTIGKKATIHVIRRTVLGF